MKKIYILLVLLLSAGFIYAQDYLTEDFSGGQMPPTDWTIDSYSSNWNNESGSNAGGSSPEGNFHWDPQFTGTSRLISPSIDLTGVTSVSLEFQHMVDHYGGAYSLGAATRSDGGDWNSIWEINPSGNVTAELLTIAISNGDVGSSDFQFCLYFSGNSYNINDWYFDDIRLFTPLAHDVMTKEILGESQYAAGDIYESSAVIVNAGLNTESFDVVLEIYDINENLLFTDTQLVSDLLSAEEETVTFNGYTLANSNDLYNVVVYTALTGDMNTDNDQKSRYINTYTTEKEIVLLEIATGTWCGYCPGAAMGADDLIDNGHAVGIIEYHGGDNYETTSSGARINYYGITGYPTAVFDGVESVVGGSSSQSMYSSYAPIADSRIEINSAFEIDIFGEETDGNYDIVLAINKLGPSLNENLVAHLALTESDIPENWGGLDHLNFVERLMAPDADGTSIDMVSNNYLEVPLSFSTDNSWVTENLELVAFIQDTDTKEILQGTKVMIDDMIPTGINEISSISSFQSFPNPFVNSTKIEFSLDKTEEVMLEVYNMNGQKVNTLINEKLFAGTHSISWNADYNSGSKVEAGIYFCKLTTANNVSTQKLVVAE